MSAFAREQAALADARRERVRAERAEEAERAFARALAEIAKNTGWRYEREVARLALTKHPGWEGDG